MADGGYPTDELVPRHHRKRLFTPFHADHVDIAMAHTTIEDVDCDIVRQEHAAVDNHALDRPVAVKRAISTGRCTIMLDDLRRAASRPHGFRSVGELFREECVWHNGLHGFAGASRAQQCNRDQQAAGLRPDVSP